MSNTKPKNVYEFTDIDLLNVLVLIQLNHLSTLSAIRCYIKREPSSMDMACFNDKLKVVKQGISL